MDETTTTTLEKSPHLPPAGGVASAASPTSPSDPAAASTPPASGSSSSSVLKVGATFPWTFWSADRDGKETEVPVTATIRALSRQVVFCDLTDADNRVVGRVHIVNADAVKALGHSPPVK